MRNGPIKIRAIRLKLGFTQEDLARKLGLVLSTVSKWEQGVTNPSRLAREKLEKFLKKEGKKKVSEPLSQGHEVVSHGSKVGMMPTRR
jgi:transcriptional regulator with XRE-family HTH domain